MHARQASTKHCEVLHGRVKLHTEIRHLNDQLTSMLPVYADIFAVDNFHILDCGLFLYMIHVYVRMLYYYTREPAYTHLVFSN